MKLQPKGMDHIGLKVTDMDASVHFYHDVLGLELARQHGAAGDDRRSAALRAGGQSLDLFYRQDFVQADKENPVGMDHVCLMVEAPSPEELMEYLRQAGVEIFWAPVERQNSTSVYIYDPDGVHVELRMDKPD